MPAYPGGCICWALLPTVQSCRTQTHAINVLAKVARPGVCRADRLTDTASRWASRLPGVRAACQPLSLVRGSSRPWFVFVSSWPFSSVSQHASMGLPYGNTKLRNGGWVVRCLSAKGGDCPPFGSCRLCGLGLFPCEVVKPTYLSACCLLCAFRPHSVQRSTRRESTPLPFQLLMFMF